MALGVAAALLAGACTSAPAPTAAGPDGGSTVVGDAATSIPPGGDGTAPPGTVPDRPGRSDGVEAIDDDGAFPALGDPDIDVLSYHLDLTYDPDTDVLDAVAELDVRAAADIDAVTLGLCGLTVEEVEVDGEPASWERSGASRERRLDVSPGRRLRAGDRVLVTVRYGGEPMPTPTAALGGIEVGWHSGDGGSFVLAEPEGACTWFPVNDHPLDKATYAIDVTVPEPYEAIASGRLEAVEPAEAAEARRTSTSTSPRPRAGDGDAPVAARTFRWRMDAPMAPYLATVVTGEYEEIDGGEIDGVAYADWLPEGTEELAAAFSDQADVVATLAAHLGPFPFETYGAIVYPDEFAAGAPRTRSFMAAVALETQGRSLYATGAADPSVVWHETAHQWMGDNVSLTDWSRDLWWVEGFASFAEHVPTLDRRGADALRARFEDIHRGRSGRPPGDVPRAQLFGDRTYENGALVFYALLQEVGEEQFWTILRTFNERYRHGNASTDDLIELSGEVAGRDLRPFFEAWLFDDEPPPLP